MMDHWGRVVLVAVGIAVAGLALPLFMATLPGGESLLVMWGLLIVVLIVGAFVFVVTRRA